MHQLRIIQSTTRQGRKGPALSNWIYEVAKKHVAFNTVLLDLAVINLPMMDEPNHPKFGKYEHEHTKKWSSIISEADAFIIVTAEYNNGYPAPLKNAIDYLNKEWEYKPVGIVSYGGVSAGTRAAASLKIVLTVLKMVPLNEAVHIPFFEQFIKEGVFHPNEISIKAVDVMLNELARWTDTLKQLRK